MSVWAIKRVPRQDVCEHRLLKSLILPDPNWHWRPFKPNRSLNPNGTLGLGRELLVQWWVVPVTSIWKVASRRRECATHVEGW